MTATTQLQQQRQVNQVQTNLDAGQGYSVTPNQGSVVPNVMQTQSILEAMLAQKNAMPNITPPSDSEIRRTSWIASGVMGLLGAIVTGNAASGIAVGMSAALALHDHGNDLRQRSEYLNELHQKGFSGPAILKWYETGDNSELDKESQRMESMARDEANLEIQGLQMKQRKDFHDDDYKQRGDHFSAMERKGNGLGLGRDHSGGMVGVDLANYIATNGVMPDGSTPTAIEMDWAGRVANKQAGGKISLTSPDPKANMANKQSLANFQRYYKTATDAINKTAQAEARLNSLDPSTPIGQLAMEFQFLTVEAPTIGNDVAKAAGVSGEAVHGWADKINQIEQEAQKNGSLTPQMVSELKSAAHAEFQAIKDLNATAAKAMADKYDLTDPTTSAAVLASTGVGDSTHTTPVQQPTPQTATTPGDYSHLWGGK